VRVMDGEIGDDRRDEFDGWDKKSVKEYDWEEPWFSVHTLYCICS